MQREPEAVDRHRYRIDQKRHVVVDDFDHRVIGMPTMLFEYRVVDAQPFAAWYEALRGLPVGKRRAVKIGDGAALKVVGVDEIVVVPQERLDDFEGWLRQSSTRKFKDIVQQVRDGFFILCLHDQLPRRAAIASIA